MPVDKEENKTTLKVVGGTDSNQRKTKVRSAKLANGLTVKQEAFAQAIFSGKNFSDSYREAFVTDRMSDSAIWYEAHTLANNPKVTRRLNELKAALDQKLSMQALSRAEKTLKLLDEIAEDSNQPANSRVAALGLLGKTVGLFTDRVEVDSKTDRSAEEIEQQLLERLQRLGIG